MFSRHVDVFAVLLIAFVLLAFSSLSSVRLPDLNDSIRIQSALFNLDRFHCR